MPRHYHAISTNFSWADISRLVNFITVFHVLPCLQTQHSTVYATNESAYLEAHADLDLLHKEIVIYVTV